MARRNDVLVAMCQGYYSHGWGGFTKDTQATAVDAMAGAVERLRGFYQPGERSEEAEDDAAVMLANLDHILGED